MELKQEHFFTVTEVAEMAGVSTQAIYKACKAGKFPTSIHWPRGHRLSRHDVIIYLAGRGIFLDGRRTDDGQ